MFKNEKFFDLQRFGTRLITLTEGNDSYAYAPDGATVLALAGNDTILNTGSNVSVDAGKGDDYIAHFGSNTTINAGEGNDSINGCSQNVKIDGGDGDDYIEHVAGLGPDWGNNTIYGGNGNDCITGSCDNVTINGGAGNDTVSNVVNGGSNVLINGDDGNDWLDHRGSDTTINGGEDDDSVFGFGDNFSLVGGAGNDYLYGQGENITLDGGDGDDHIDAGSYSSVSGGDGNDFIFAGLESITIDAGTGDDTIENHSKNSTVMGGDGDDSISNEGWMNENGLNRASKTLLDAGNGNDIIYNDAVNYKVTINGGAGNDTIFNYAESVSIDSGADADSIKNNGATVTILSGTGSDTITNGGENVTINSGAGADKVSNTGANASIVTGADNDSINNSGSYVTINAGKGNDTIKNSGSNVLFNYASGDGNDVITGFNITSTLKIGDGTGTYSKETVDDDNIIVTIGDGKISLMGAANLSKVNVNGEEIFTDPVWSLNGTIATYGTPKETLITVSGVKSLDGLSISGKVVTVSNASLNQKVVTISDGYTLKLGSDVAKTSTAAAGWTLNGTTATYKSAKTTAGYKLADNKISYVTASGGSTLATVSGVKSLDGLSISGKVVTVSNASLNKSAVTISDGYTLKLGSDVAKTSTAAATWTLSNSTATYKSAKTTAGYKLSDNKISYVTASGGNTLATVSGVKSLDGLSISGKVVTVSNASLNQKVVTISDGYTLKLGSDVAKTSTTAAGWTLSNSTATYKSAKTTAGYKLSDNKISYVTASGGDTLVTVKGVKSLDGLSISGKVVTVSNASLNKSAVTISDGYTLKLGSDVAKTSTAAASWTLSNSTATYKSAKTTAGYKLSDNKISYVTASGGDTLVTVKGVKSLDGLSLSNKVVTVSNASLNQKVVTISDGYTLKLGSDVTKTSTTAASWTLNNSTATYKSAKTTAGYKLADNKISYVTASGGKDLFTIAGINSTTGVSLKDKAVTLTETALANRAADVITISDGYTLKLAAGVDTIKEAVSTWSTIDGGNVAYFENGTGEYYSLSGGNKITYNKSVAGKNKVELNGIKGTPKLGDGIVSLTANNFAGDASVVSNAGNYGFALSGKLASKTFTATGNADKIINSGSKVTIAGGKGNDTITNHSGGKNVLFSYNTGDGNDTIYGFNATSTLQIDGGTGTYSKAKSKSGADIIVTVGKGKITLVDAASLSKVNIKGTFKKETSLMVTNKTANSIVAGTAYDDEIDNRAKNVTISGGDGNDLITTLRKTSNVKIYGDSGEDTLESYNATKVLLSGGNGNDEIYVSGGSDNTLEGGTGDDAVEIDSTTTNTLIKYASGDGNDSIIGFNETSTLQIGEGTSTYSTVKGDNADDVILRIGDGRITLVGAASWLKFTDDESPTNIKGKFQAGNILTVNNNTNASLLSSIAEDIDIVDATKRTKTVRIVGNVNNNTIYGGSNKNSIYGGEGYDYLVGGKVADILDGGADDDTLSGGAGNDTLTGGAGDDLFVYTAGKDVIADYTSGDDTIQLASKYTKSSIKGSDVVLTFGSSKTLTIKDAKYKEITFVDADGNESSERFGVTIVKTAKYTANDKEEYLDATERKGTTNITGNELNNTIYGASAYNNTINGGAGADYLVGGKKADKLFGGADDDTLSGGAGNDTLTGGAGDDLFIYTAGKDVITDYTSGDDTIQLVSKYTNSSIKGSDVVLTFGSSKTLTIKDAKYKEVTFVDVDGNESTEIFGVTIVKTAKYTASDKEEYLDATERKGTTNITGNDLNNTILGASAYKNTINGAAGADYLVGGKANDVIYGGADDDTLWGGKGADTLYGGEGADTFIYSSGDGKDVIYDFDENDMLQITGKFAGTYNAGTNAITFKVNGSSSNTITLKDYETSVFNVNGDSYEIKGSKLVKQE